MAEFTLFGGPGDGLAVTVAPFTPRIKVYLVPAADPKLVVPAGGSGKDDRPMRHWVVSATPDPTGIVAHYVWSEKHKRYQCSSLMV